MANPRALRCIDLGEGSPVLVLHAYGMSPRAYLPLACKLGRRARAVIPDLFALSQWRELWTFGHLLDSLAYTLDDLGIDRASFVGHSFGGGLALGFAAHHSDRLQECVFVDTLGPKRQLSLAREAARPVGLLRTASRPAAASFLWSWVAHPVQLASAAVDGYLSRRTNDIETVAQLGVPCHVLWAADDKIISEDDGQEFARRLRGTFTVAEPLPDGPPLGHDWIIDEPEIFVTYLDKLGLRAFAQSP
jgi:pimeloyl-ACP methyl ester carboxylesterase